MDMPLAPSARALDLAQTLVRMNTVSRGSNLELIHFVRDELAKHGVASTLTYDDARTKANLFATLGEGKPAGVIVSGHTDTVPWDGQDWTLDPLGAELRDGKLYGRGSADMKGFIGLALAQTPAFLAADLPFAIHFAFSYDEEVGCFGGAQLAAALGARAEPPATCIVGEPSSMRVIAAHKSSNLVELVFHGRSAHSSLTPEGVNAIEYAARAITAIRDIADARRTDGPFDQAYRVPWTTAGVNMVDGGIASNTVPELCHVYCDFRTVGVDDPALVIEEITRRARELEAQMQAEHAEAFVEVNVVAQVPSLESSATGPAYALACDLGGTSSPDKVTYGTEAGQFANAGIDAVVCGPGDIAQAHAADEYVELDQILACERLVDALLARLTRTAA